MQTINQLCSLYSNDLYLQYTLPLSSVYSSAPDATSQERTLVSIKCAQEVCVVIITTIGEPIKQLGSHVTSLTGGELESSEYAFLRRRTTEKRSPRHWILSQRFTDA